MSMDPTATTAKDPGAEYWPEGDLPEQFGGSRTTLMPGQRTFRLPDNLAQLWHDVEIADGRSHLANGQPNPTFNQKIKRKQLKFTRDAPLVVVGGPDDGLPMTATFTNNPRARGKKDDPKTPWISDLAFFLEVGLQDKSRPATPEALVAAINRYAGKTIRLETGLSGQCRPDKVKWIEVVVDGQASVIADPQNQKGCGKRFNNKDFKDPTTGKYDQEVACNGEVLDPATGQKVPCNAILKGYESVERILAPVGQVAPAAVGAR